MLSSACRLPGFAIIAAEIPPVRTAGHGASGKQLERMQKDVPHRAETIRQHLLLAQTLEMFFQAYCR